MKKILIIVGLIACLSLVFVGSSYCAYEIGGGGSRPPRGDYHYRYA